MLFQQHQFPKFPNFAMLVYRKNKNGSTRDTKSPGPFIQLFFLSLSESKGVCFITKGPGALSGDFWKTLITKKGTSRTGKPRLPLQSNLIFEFLPWLFRMFRMQNSAVFSALEVAQKVPRK